MICSLAVTCAWNALLTHFYMVPSGTLFTHLPFQITLPEGVSPPLLHPPYDAFIELTTTFLCYVHHCKLWPLRNLKLCLIYVVGAHG